MAFFDISLDLLKTYIPTREEPADFDAFWQSTLAEARAFPFNATFEKVDSVSLRRKLSMSHSQASADNLSKAG